MKDSFRHIFLKKSSNVNRTRHVVCVLLWFSTSFGLEAQHINNGLRLGAIHKRSNTTLSLLTNTYNVTGGGSYCSGGAGLPVGLDGSEPGGSYQLQLNGVNTGAPVTGTGSAFNFPNQTAAGTYTVVATVAGVPATMNGNAVITINSPPSVTANNTQVCFGNNSVALTGSPSGGTWTGTGVSGSNFNANGLAAGDYTVTYLYTDVNGCSGSADATVTVNALPTAFASSNSPQCTGSTLNLTSSGGVTYSWTGPNGFTSGLQNPSITNVSTAADGTYTVTVTDANGCSASATTDVTITKAPTASISYSGTPFCTSLNTAQAVTLSGTGSYTGGTYSAPAGLTINSSTGAITPNTSTAGTYTVTYTIPASGGCAAVTATTSVTITALPTATINYSGTPFCTTLNTAQTVTLSGTGAYTGGTYSASPAGLTINSSTGAITPNTSTAGTYTVTYTIPASGGCAAVTATTSVAITALPTASLTYSGSPFCKSVATAQSATLTGTGAYTGGTYSASPAGLTINSSTGAITPNTSTAGTYTVTYTIPASGGCAAVNTTATVTITAVPVATFSYTGTPYCQNAGNPSPTFSGGGVAGTFSASPAGLVFISTSTGQVDLTASTPGTYTVTNTIAAAGGCAAVTATSGITITAVPSATISYAGNPFCKSLATAQSVTITGTGAYTGGTYSASPAGLTINSSTGAITPNTSTAGTYTVTYTIPASGGCAAVTATTSVTITASPTATINYSGTPFCTTVNTAQAVTLSGTGAYTGGTYSASPAGLTINSSTGAITPNTSTAGTYTVTYTIPASGGCAAVTATTSVAITALPTASLTYSGSPFCKSVATAQSATLTGTGAYTGGTYSASPAGLTINSSTGAITPNTSTAGTYTVTYTIPASGGCAAVNTTATVTITAVPVATFSYTGTPYCQNAGNPSPTFSGGGVAGTFSASPAGLVFISTSTGQVDLTASTPGTYTVTNTIAAAGGCAAVTATSGITITAVPSATISYAGNPFCKSLATAQSVTITGTGAYTGGTYSAPAGLTINSSTGAITPNTSTAGTYTVTYSKPAAGGCAAISATASVTITAVPTASITYAGTPFCTTVSAAQPVTLTGMGAYTGGTYSAPAGLSINNSTGAITPNTSTAGTYTVTYTIPASAGCAAGSASTSVTITASPTASISYTGNPFCATVSTLQPVTLTGTGAYTGGTFSSSPAGLNINSSGSIRPSSSTPGTYTVTYTTPASGGCAAVTATVSVTITSLPVATFSYTGSPYCKNAANPSPTFSGGGVAGTFSASPAGLVFISAATGQIDLASSTAGTYTVTNTIAASGGCAAVTATANVTISTVPTASISYAGNPFCKSPGTAQSVTLTGTGAYTGGTFSSSPAGLTINSSTGAITPSSSTAGTYTVTYSKGAAGGCSAISTTTTVTITAAPTAAISYSASAFCTGITITQSVTLTGTGAYTGGTFSASPAGLSINSTTGGISPSSSTAGTYTITYTSPATGGCAAVTATATVIINLTPTITVSPTSSAFCSGNSVTLTASGASTYTWSPATDLSITTGSIVIAYPSITTTYTVTGTASNGCSSTASVPITVTQSPYGDVSSSPPVCPGSNGGTLTLSNYSGNILRWESSTDGGSTWTTISNTTTTQSYANLTTTTIYRVYLELNGCYSYSSIGIIPVNPAFTPTVTATPTSFCLGGSSALHASDYGAPPFPIEDFKNANPAGWNGNDANNNNKDDNSDWGESSNGKTWNGVTYNSNAAPTNTKFMIINGDGGGSVASLITPPFSLVGLTSPVFNYYTALNFNAGTTAWVEISTDGGNTYTVLKTYTGPTNVGNPNNGWTQESINLSAYIGQSNVKVRFRYSGTAGSNWAIDNVGINGTYQPVTYQWSPTTYLTPSNGVGQNVTTTPTVAGTYNYCVVATTAAGCSSSPVCVDVTAKPIPTCSITGNNTVCPGSTNVYSAPAIAGYTYSWTISGGATISGSATGQTVTVNANSTCGTYTLTLVTTLNGCSSTPCTQIVNVVDNTAPVATAPATQSFQCLADVPAPGTLTATDNCSGNITATGIDVQVANGCGYTITRKWTFTDACNNTSSVSQIINVLDNTAPVAPAAPASQNFQCLADVPAPGTLTATDNCSGNITATGVDVQVAKACGYTITRTWTFTDACNNTSSVSQVINVQDNIPPVITCPPAQLFCEVNSNTYTIPPATASDNCSGALTVTYKITGATIRSGTGTDASGIFNIGVSTITWTVTDACGNTSTCTTLVTISSKPAPIITHN